MPYTAKRPRRRRRPSARVMVPGRRGWKTVITIVAGQPPPFRWIGAKGPVIRRPLSLVKPEREMRRALVATFSSTGSALPRGLRQSGLLQRLADDAKRRAEKTKQGPIGRGNQPLGAERTRVLQDIFRYGDMEMVADLFANDRDAFEAELAETLTGQYQELFERGGQAARRSLGIRGSFNLEAPGIAQALEDRANRLAGNVATDVFDRLKTVIADGFYLQGKSPLDVAEALTAEFDWLSDSRARTIARTETGTVTEGAQWVTYSASGVPFKRWLTTLDGKERDTHHEAHGQIRPIDEPFDVGDAQLMYPLDPETDHLEEIINCRCSQIPIVTAEQALSDADVWDGRNEPDQFARERERDPDQPPGLRPPDPSSTDDLDFAFPEDEKRWFGFGKAREYVRDEAGRFAEVPGTADPGISDSSAKELAARQEQIVKSPAVQAAIQKRNMNQAMKALSDATGVDLTKADKSFINSWKDGSFASNALAGTILAGKATPQQLAAFAAETGVPQERVKDYVQSRYLLTQAMLDKPQYDLHRGISGQQGARMRKMMKEDANWDPISIRVRSISSFSSRRKIADFFGPEADKTGVAFKLNVPRERIFMHHSTDSRMSRGIGGNESEVVVWDEDNIIDVPRGNVRFESGKSKVIRPRGAWNNPSPIIELDDEAENWLKAAATVTLPPETEDEDEKQAKAREYVRDEIGRFGTGGGAGGDQPDARFAALLAMPVDADPAEVGQAVVDIGVAGFDRSLPKLAEGDTVGGLKLSTTRVDNTGSISASIDDSIKLTGVRAVPMSLFGVTGPEPVRSYSVTEQRRIEGLRDDIRASGAISPLIVAMDKKNGPYILEGGHRFDALKALGVDSFPALVVFDDTDGDFSQSGGE